MDWLKRNLFFVIGGLLAVLLLGGAGFYLYKNFDDRKASKQKLEESYQQLEQLTSMEPGPGDGKKMDNIQSAKEYRTNLLSFIDRSGKYFDLIPAIPASTNPTPAEFAAALRVTIGQMQRAAIGASVQLPPDPNFSFKAMTGRITFTPGTLQPLSVQLGEVKAISDIVFKAKVNSFDSVRRERVSPDDTDSNDYIDDHSVTNEIAVITPYEISFRCFSTELAGVMTGFSTSTHCFIVKSVNIVAGETPTTTPGGGPAQPAPTYQPRGTYPPVGYPQTRGGATRGGEDYYFFDANPTTVLDEQPLRVTMMLELVKPLNPAK